MAAYNKPAYLMQLMANPENSLKTGFGHDPIDTDIHYVFCIPDSGLEDVTFFQGYARGLLGMPPALHALTMLPIDLEDPAQPKQGRMARRMSGAGSWRWMILNTSTLRELPIGPQRPFWVIFSENADTANTIASLTHLHLPPLHVSRHGLPGAIALHEINQDAVRSHVLATLDRLALGLPGANLSPYRALLNQWRPFEAEILPVFRKSHPMTFPNHVVAESLGYQYRAEGSFHADDESDYAPAMAESARTILDLRDTIPAMLSDVLFPRWPSLILHAPAENRATTARPLGKLRDADARAIYDVQLMLRRQRGFLVPMDEGVQDRLAASPIALGAFQLRRQELSIYAHLIALRAASTVSATIRMPPAINRAFGTIAAFGNHARSAAQRRPPRMKRLLDTVQARLRSAVSDDAMVLIERAGPTGIKLVSDAPLEWLPVRGLPLGIRYDVSRVGATPGNLMAMQMFLHRPIRLRPADLRRVLVVTSYEAKDRIRTLLIDRLRRMAPMWEGNLSLKIVPVGSLEEFREALARFDGHVMIFDGHGEHPNGDVSLGTLMIAGKPVDIWDQRGDIRVPPIIILSACDTHGADRNHNSAANGFLACGARAVLATLLPIDASDAAEFAARLLLRIANGIEPIIKVVGRAVLWSEIVGGLLRMKMSTDVATPFLKSGQIPLENYRELRQEANVRINLGDFDWYEWQVAELAKRCGLTAGEVESITGEAIAVSDAIRYVHMGNPESIAVGTVEDLPDAIRAELVAETEE
ncbi:MAG TPA: CHAT domain-containing protein [Allosphingosinicella sp.]